MVQKYLEERALGIGDVDVDLAVLASLLLHHGAAKLLVDHLHAVADAEHGQPQPEDLGVVGGRVVGVDALGAARDDDSGELVVLLDVMG